MKYINGIYSQVVLIIVLLLAYSVAFGDVYKWVDKDGNTVYSQDPPAGNVEYESVGTPAKVDSAAALKRLRDDKIRAQKLRRERMEKQSENRKSMSEVEDRDKNCHLAREKLEGLQRPRISVQQADGGFARMSEEERQKQIKEAQAKVREWCE